MLVADILKNPQAIIKKLSKKADLTAGLMFFVIWTVAAAVINSIITVLQRNAYVANLGAQATQAVPSMSTVFIDSFTRTELNSIIIFGIMIVLVHVFMNALNVKQKINKFAALLSYPFGAIAATGAIISIISYALSVVLPATGTIALFVSIILSAALIATVVYGFIIYSETAAIAYKTNLQTATISVILAALIILASTASQTVGQALMGLI